MESVSKNGHRTGREDPEDKMKREEQFNKDKLKNKKTPVGIPRYRRHSKKAKLIRLSALKKEKDLILKT